MKRFLILCLLGFCAPVAFAEEIEFSFGDEEVQEPAPKEQEMPEPAPIDSIGDSGEMSFGAEEIQAEAVKAKADEKATQKLIRVLQRRPFLRKKRYELSPELGVLVNDSLVNGVSFGGRFSYHLSEIMAVSVSGAATASSETALFEKVIEDYAVFPEVSKVLWRTSVDYQYAFLYGKFALFNRWIIAWDTVASLGLGALQTELAIHPTLTAGIGQRFFMTQWFTVNVGLQDYLYLEDYAAGGELINHLVFTGGVSFFFPTTFTYRTLR